MCGYLNKKPAYLAGLFVFGFFGAGGGSAGGLCRRRERGTDKMSKTPIESAADIQSSGLLSDNRELASHGISPCSEEAVPYYSAWTRTDIALSAALLASIADDTRVLLRQAKLITVAAWIIVILMMGSHFGR